MPRSILCVLLCTVWCGSASAQTPAGFGRDVKEPSQVIGKQFLLRIWLSNVGGAGIQQIRSARVADDGTITLVDLAPIKAEGVAIAAVEAAVTAGFKARWPQANAYVTVLERTPPPPPPPPPPPATTQAATAPATTQATSAPANKPVAPAMTSSKPAN